MPLVPLTVNGRTYEIACDPGQEEQLRRLGGELAARVDRLIGQVGQIGDAQLMLMAGLLVADELEGQRSGGPDDPARAVAELDTIAVAIGDLASRVEAIAGKLEAA
ncbi:MAG: cell division protein ZapA [Dongiaceae bacterium]